MSEMLLWSKKKQKRRNLSSVYNFVIVSETKYHGGDLHRLHKHSICTLSSYVTYVYAYMNVYTYRLCFGKCMRTLTVVRDRC